MTDRNDHDAPLTGAALTIWQEVVCGGEHLEVTRAGQRVAVIMPFDEWEDLREAAASEVTHRCPPTGSGIMPCCGRAPFEVPRTDRMTLDPSLVTCSEAAHIDDLRGGGDDG